MLVKITGNITKGYPYYNHENDLKLFNTETYYDFRGYAVVLSVGDIYVYVGEKEKSYKITADLVANGVDSKGDPLFVKVGNVMEMWLDK